MRVFRPLPLNRPMSRRPFPPGFAFLLATAFLVANLYAEAYPPQLSGTVVDTSGALIIGATVQVRNSDGTVQRTTQSDSNGSFTISGLPAGKYQLVVSNPGFETKELAVTMVLPFFLELLHEVRGVQEPAD